MRSVAPSPRIILSRPRDASSRILPNVGDFQTRARTEHEYSAARVGDRRLPRRRAEPAPRARRGDRLAVRGQAAAPSLAGRAVQPRARHRASRHRRGGVLRARRAVARRGDRCRHAQRARVPLDPQGIGRQDAHRAHRAAVGGCAPFRPGDHHAAVPPARGSARAAEHADAASRHAATPRGGARAARRAARGVALATHCRDRGRPQRALCLRPARRGAARTAGIAAGRGARRQPDDHHQRAHAARGARRAARQRRGAARALRMDGAGMRRIPTLRISRAPIA